MRGMHVRETKAGKEKLGMTTSKKRMGEFAEVEKGVTFCVIGDMGKVGGGR